jgi:thymidine kinase
MIRADKSGAEPMAQVRIFQLAVPRDLNAVKKVNVVVSWIGVADDFKANLFSRVNDLIR